MPPKVDEEFSDVGWADIFGKKRREVWQYFMVSCTDKDVLKCKVCSKIMRGSSSITSFKYHLENVHKINLADPDTSLIESSEGTSKKTKDPAEEFYRIRKFW